MEDFYPTFLQGLPHDEWGHPVLPTPDKPRRREYTARLRTLQIELVKMQQWAHATGERVLLLFEGRDTAGKGGTIQRMREHMNPRFARHVALPVPNETEGGQWYFQRYVEQLPTRGEVTFFDRSWYNRAGVERVMQHVLGLVPYDAKDAAAIGTARPDIVAPVRALLPTIAPEDTAGPGRP